jgi:hypothetical protein
VYARAPRYSGEVSKTDIVAHCGEFCEVRTPYASYFGRLLRIAGDRFELEAHDRRGCAVAVFAADEVLSIASIRAPHY